MKCTISLIMKISIEIYPYLSPAKVVQLIALTGFKGLWNLIQYYYSDDTYALSVYCDCTENVFTFKVKWELLIVFAWVAMFKRYSRFSDIKFSDNLGFSDNFSKTIFHKLHEIIRFSDIMQFSDSFCGDQRCH